MKKDLEQLLAEKYSFMTRKDMTKEKGLNRSMYDMYGCECSDGWYELLDNLCKDITTIYNQENIEIDLVIKQIKEKFGTLRFYYTTKNSESDSVYIDCLGEISLRYSYQERKVDVEVRKLVDHYCTKSASVCEMCGEKGVLRRDLPWIQTLCDSCYSSMKKDIMR